MLGIASTSVTAVPPWRTLVHAIVIVPTFNGAVSRALGVTWVTVTEDDEEFGIDELARRAGTTVRNVRLYVERGLLPRPRRQGRTSLYRDLHLIRLQLVLRLIGRGFSLSAIKELTEAWDADRGLGDVLGIEDALASPFATEPPTRVDLGEITRRFPSDEPEATLARSIELGLVVPDGEDFIVAIPAFFDAGAELVASGVPVSAVLDVAAQTRRATAVLADAFVSVFMQHIWEPFDAAGQPPDRLNDIVDSINRQRPLATHVVVAALGQAMQERVDEALMTGTDQPSETEGIRSA
jgi:DNA-binding transcriptional MerR regulator